MQQTDFACELYRGQFAAKTSSRGKAVKHTYGTTSTPIAQRGWAAS